MPNQTAKLKLNTFLENEAVNFEDLNENFEKIDGYVICTGSGTRSSAYTEGANSTATWHYKKYSDGTIDMSTKLEFTNLVCNRLPGSGSGSVYRSVTSTVNFPFGTYEIYDVQIHLVSDISSYDNHAWVSNITDRNVTNALTFRLNSSTNEGSNRSINRQVYINIKGVLDE